MTARTDRLLLALEVLFGVVPITMVGGLYSILGLYFGAVALILSLSERAAGALPLWLGILALAAGGIAGLGGLWSLVIICATRRPPGPRLVRAAVVGCAIGVATAIAAIVLMYRSAGFPAWVVAALVAPVFVVVHRLPPIARGGNGSGR